MGLQDKIAGYSASQAKKLISFYQSNVLTAEKYTISFIFESHCFLSRNMSLRPNVTGKIAQNPAIAHTFWVSKLCAITGFYCTSNVPTGPADIYEVKSF